MRALIALTLLAGCFPERSAELVCSVDTDCEDGRVCEDGFCVKTRQVDAGPGDDTDAPPAVNCADFNGQGFMGCNIPAPKGELVLDAAGTFTYDTNTGVLTGPAGTIEVAKQSQTSGAMLISVDKLTVASGATLRVTGLRPLIVASWSTISIAGTVDASSTLQSAGAGANPGACAGHAPADGIGDPEGSDGGGGGGYSGAGGVGGLGNGVAPPSPPGGSAAAMGMLQGGCPGGKGGDGVQPGGAAGPGGGAIQLSALTSVDVGGRVLAGGGGGGGGTGNNGGGGGGGSGGMILLESKTVTSAAGAILAANGGGGGGGAGDGAAQPGGNGGASATAATAGTGAAGGSNGGIGAAGTTLAGGAGVNDNDRGAGGGGGGAGYIVIMADTPASPSGIVSPAATLLAR